MKTLCPVILSVLLTIVLNLPAAAGHPSVSFPHENLEKTFASCSGRLSALMEYQWLIGDNSADTTKAQRAEMLQLLDSVIQPGHEVQLRALRIETKYAHTQLLHQATFATPRTGNAEAAMRRAQYMIENCLVFLLP